MFCPLRGLRFADNNAKCREYVVYSKNLVSFVLLMDEHLYIYLFSTGDSTGHIDQCSNLRKRALKSVDTFLESLGQYDDNSLYNSPVSILPGSIPLERIPPDRNPTFISISENTNSMVVAVLGTGMIKVISEAV